MFGGKKPAPALPSRMVGTVECDAVKAPMASDDVLRRAMGAAAGDAAAAEEASRRIYRHKEDEAAEVKTLPTLFLHGKPDEEVVAEEPAPPAMEREDSIEQEAPSLGVTGLLASMDRVELDSPTELAADILLARAQDEVRMAEPAHVDEVERVEEVEEVVAVAEADAEVADDSAFEDVVAAEEQVDAPLAPEFEAAQSDVHEPEIMAVTPEPNYPDANPAAIEALFEAEVMEQAPAAAERPAVETVAGLVAAADADLVEEPEAPVEDVVETVAREPVLEEPVAEEPVAAEAEEPVESLASLADAMDEVATQVGARAAARDPAKRKAAPRRKADPSTKRRKSKNDLPDDAVWLTDALIWSQCGSWREFWLPPTDASSSQRLEEFRAHAAAGTLKVWAKADGTDEWVLVTASHWKKAGFDPLAFLAGRENAFSQAPAPKARRKADAPPPKEPVKYGHLMVSRAEVEVLFGPAADGDTAAVA